ncbi:MAG TPA: hypothetical protein VJ780_06160, partial [Flavobacterium sp.]|nr:hypothetical protein [Flavobacterium sp.]
GVVSLAAALSIPLYLQSGEIFPQRNLILFITFIVILLTLIVQGLTLPIIIKKAKLKEIDYALSEEEVNHYLDKEIHMVALKHLQNNYNDTARNSNHYQGLITFLQNQLSDESEFNKLSKSTEDYRLLINLQRNRLIQINKTRYDLNEEIIRKKIMILDYQEEKLNLKG